MKFDKICMNCGKKFKKLKYRVLQKDKKNYRDFCCVVCLVEYYSKCSEMSGVSQ